MSIISHFIRNFHNPTPDGKNFPSVYTIRKLVWKKLTVLIHCEEEDDEENQFVVSGMMDNTI